MKIAPKNIPQSGLDFTRRIDPVEIDAVLGEFSIVSPLDVTVHLERIANSVTARITVAMTRKTDCARCLKEITDTTEKKYTFNYLIENELIEIDLGEDMRQELILDIPQRILCADECKGICQSCGTDLNNGTCSCTKTNDKKQKAKTVLQ